MIVDIAIPLRVWGTFHYEINPEIEDQVELGSILEVPFGRRKTHGFVMGFPKQADVPSSKLRQVETILNRDPIFDAQMLKFLRWVSDYYCHPLGEVIAAAAPKNAWTAPKSKRNIPDLTGDGALPIEYKPSDQTARPKLTEEQDFAVSRILESEDKKPILLHGVTGSGKTEVYMSVLEQVLKAGRSAIILVPEISLTPQLLGRFSSRFPQETAVLHSDLTSKERYIQWQRVYRGFAKVVIGARSAVFAPVKNLGLIVVDEEQEASFKQEDSLRYHARDVAVVRGQMEGAKVILGSATPSVESFYNADSGKYTRVTLTERVHKRSLPKSTFVDLRNTGEFYSPKTQWLSRTLVAKIQQCLSEKQQALLYLNRLGYAHFIYCQDCGHTWNCRNCEVSLTYYHRPPRLKCHYCGASHFPPQKCDQCQGIKIEAMGVGTEQVENELVKIFPEARIARMDRSVIRTRKALEAILTKINEREVDVVIGTQMLAKGHDFPGIALVGILLADASLSLPDFRAYEKTFQIITQVSGRAGRAGIQGEVVVQTVNPEHPVLLAASENRTIDFYRREIENRKRLNFPPSSRMAMLRFQHSNSQRVEAFAQKVSQGLLAHFHGKKFDLIGPSEAPLSKVKNLYRWHCLIKSDSVQQLKQVIAAANHYTTVSKSPVQMAVDVDPIHLW